MGNEGGISRRPRLVVCNAAVVDKNGHLVTDLPRSAFHRSGEWPAPGDPQFQA